MERATISKLKNNLSAYLRKVRAGHPVIIYDREVPIARIERIEAVGGAADRLASLRAQGVIRPPRRALDRKWLRVQRRALPSGARLLDALREDRESSR